MIRVVLSVFLLASCGTNAPKGVRIDFAQLMARAQPFDLSSLPLPETRVLKATIDGKQAAESGVINWPPSLLCDVPFADLPNVVCHKSKPIADEDWSVGWCIRPRGQFIGERYTHLPIIGGQTEDRASMLFVSTRLLEEPQPIEGASGCFLAVPPDLVFVPDRRTLHDGIFTQDDEGQISLRFTFPSFLVGWTFYAQLIAEDRRNDAGLTVSMPFRIQPGEL